MIELPPQGKKLVCQKQLRSGKRYFPFLDTSTFGVNSPQMAQKKSQKDPKLPKIERKIPRHQSPKKLT